MRQDSETNIIVINTALQYKIPSRKKTIHKHILKSASAEAREICGTLKAFTEEKLVTSHGKLFQTLITRSEKNTDRVALLQSLK